MGVHPPLLQRYDLFLTPTIAVPPFQAGAEGPREANGRAIERLGWTPFTYPFNLTGNPALTVPAGFTASGLPVGLQIVGRRFDEATCCAPARPSRRRAPGPTAGRRRMCRQLNVSLAHSCVGAGHGASKECRSRDRQRYSHAGHAYGERHFQR